VRAVKEIDLVYRTMYAELAQRSFDASFDSTFPLTGNFLKIPVDGREYWYFHHAQAEPARRYVGPVADKALTARVTAFKRVKDDVRGRRKLVSTLIREAGLPAAERMTGDVVEALEKAGIFRLRGVLVGPVAFQTYSAHLGVRLAGAAMQTGDADFAQYHSISAAVGDAMPPILEVLRTIEPSFRPIPHAADGTRSTRYVNDRNYHVEFLTPNRGSDDHADRPVQMPALGGTAAQPLRFLDFLIREPIRAVLLHKAGVPVLVPAPERYAVHKFIVASRRRNDANGTGKQEKDVHQARLLIEALALTRQQAGLAEAFAEAWKRGPHWREAISRGVGYLGKEHRQMADEMIAAGLAETGEELPGYPLPAITP
jgi:hypothetical protein